LSTLKLWKVASKEQGRELKLPPTSGSVRLEINCGRALQRAKGAEGTP